MAIELLEQALPEGGPHILALDRHPLPPRHPLGRPQPDTHHEVPAEEGVLIQEDQLQVSIPGRKAGFIYNTTHQLSISLDGSLDNGSIWCMVQSTY